MKRQHKYPIVAIVGRANVGKSTLWNRLTETTRALVSTVPHTTRDRNYALTTWRGLCIETVDTGGLDADQGSEIGRGIIKQAEYAIREADLVLLLVDAEDGVLKNDIDLAKTVRAINKHIILVANKIDNPDRQSLAATKELFSLGFGQGLPISASTGRGVGDLLDAVYDELERLGKHPAPIETNEGLKLVIMGRPNVGKSSLMNAILGEERVIVSSIPHTTREPQDTTFEWKGERVTLIDTAGMRKRSHVEPGLEKAGVDRNEQALMKADVALLVFDSTEDVTTQDRHLAGLLENAGRGLILVANKWDLVEDKTTRTTDEYEKLIRQTFPFLSWAPIYFVSAKKRQRTDKLLDHAFTIREERRRQIAYNALQRFLKTVLARKKPLARIGAKSPYVYDVTQIGIEPPNFLMTIRGEKETVHASWLRYFENRLREKFGFDGTPVIVRARQVPFSKSHDEKDYIKSAEPKKKLKHPWARKRRPIGRIGRY